MTSQAAVQREARAEIPTARNCGAGAGDDPGAGRARRAAGRQSRMLPGNDGRAEGAGFFKILQPRPGAVRDGAGTFASPDGAGRGDASVAGSMACRRPFLAPVPVRRSRPAGCVGADNTALIVRPIRPPGRAGRRRLYLQRTLAVSSGAEQCDWTFLGGIVSPEKTAGRPFLEPITAPSCCPEGLRDRRHLARQRLKGSGSQDIVVTDCSCRRTARSIFATCGR